MSLATMSLATMSLGGSAWERQCAPKARAGKRRRGLADRPAPAMAKRLGVKVAWSGTPFEQPLPSLQTGRADFIISGFSDRASRREAADFVDCLITDAQFFAGMEFGSVLQRQGKRDPSSQGGWSAGAGNWQGIDCVTPVGHPLLPGDASVAGWFRSGRMEVLRSNWLEAPGPAAQQGLCRGMQDLAWDEVPFLPLGGYMQPTAHRTAITGVLNGTAVFWNVRPA